MTEWQDDHTGNDEQSFYEEPPRNTTGSMLFYFFAAVILCAVSVGIGYMMGKRSAPPPADAAQATQPAATSGAAKPGASRSETPLETSTPDVEASPSPAPVSSPAQAPAQKPVIAKAAAKTPELASSPGKGFMVQVAAVTRQEDADTLAGALRKKKYPVFVLPPAGSDKFYHVQVGPFAEMKDADAMKAKLAGDGYNAIVKK